MTLRSEYVIDDAGWDKQGRQAAVLTTLAAVAHAVTKAETDIPWHKHAEWPPEARAAAVLLRDRFISHRKQDEDYLQTGVQRVDEPARQAFTTFAAFAYDCTLWSDEGELASVNDEGDSLVIFLTPDEADELRATLGHDRVVSAEEWRDRHPSAFTRLLRRFRDRG